jgi:hypothetical protein
LGASGSLRSHTTTPRSARLPNHGFHGRSRIRHRALPRGSSLQRFIRATPCHPWCPSPPFQTTDFTRAHGYGSGLRPAAAPWSCSSVQLRVIGCPSPPFQTTDFTDVHGYGSGLCRAAAPCSCSSVQLRVIRGARLPPSKPRISRTLTDTAQGSALGLTLPSSLETQRPEQTAGWRLEAACARHVQACAPWRKALPRWQHFSSPLMNSSRTPLRLLIGRKQPPIAGARFRELLAP